MRCPYCGHHDLKVVDSRDSEVGEAIRRRRECLGCGQRFTTYERIEAVPFYVIKKDGRREDFDPQKLVMGLRKATEKRDISQEKLRAIVDEIEADLRRSGRVEIPHYVGDQGASAQGNANVMDGFQSPILIELRMFLKDPIHPIRESCLFRIVGCRLSHDRE